MTTNKEKNISPGKGDVAAHSLPLMTLIILGYNHQEFIREAIEGAFSQTYENLEIVVSDDSSSDGTFFIMKEMVTEYHGPHRVILNRNKKNLGLAAHVNKVIEISNGEIILLSGGDDISLPERSTRSCEILMENQDLTCVSFDTVTFRTSEELKTKSTEIPLKIQRFSLNDLIRNSSLHTNGASRAFHKRVPDSFGPLLGTSPTEDSTTLLRCLLLGNAAQVAEQQVCYRVHGDNMYASANKYRIDYRAIYQQYLQDLKSALEAGIITKEKFDSVIQSLDRKLARNLLQCEFYLSNRKKLFFLTRLLTSDIISFREKYSFLKNAVIS